MDSTNFITLRHDLGTLDVQLDGPPGNSASSWEVAAAEGSADNGTAALDFFPASQAASPWLSSW